MVAIVPQTTSFSSQFPEGMKSFVVNDRKSAVLGKGACTDVKVPRVITPHGSDPSRWQQPSLSSRHLGGKFSSTQALTALCAACSNFTLYATAESDIVLAARSMAVAAPECTSTPPSIRPGTNRTLQCVDISDFENRKEEIVRNIMAAADIGFFYITGHGIPQELIDEAFATNKRYTWLGERGSLREVKQHSAIKRS